MFPITAIESVNDRYESFHSFLIQILEMYAQEQNGECDRARKSVLDILLIAMQEVTEEFSDRETDNLVFESSSKCSKVMYRCIVNEISNSTFKICRMANPPFPKKR